MTQLPTDNNQWQEFVRQHCSTPPPAAPDLEQQLMNAIDKTPQQPAISWRWLAVPPAIAASLLMAVSSYRILIAAPEPSSSASLEAFWESNWNQVVGETPASSQNNSLTSDWSLEVSAAQ